MLETFIFFLAQGVAVLCVATILFFDVDPVMASGGLGAALSTLASRWAKRPNMGQITYWAIVAAALPFGTLVGLLLFALSS